MPAQAAQQEKYGEWAFLLGLALVLIVGIASGVPAVGSNLGVIYAILAVLGLAVGFLNISEKEVDSFLIATIALMAVSSALKPLVVALNVAVIGDVLTNLLSALAAFVAPAALIVAILLIYKLGKSK